MSGCRAADLQVAAGRADLQAAGRAELQAACLMGAGRADLQAEVRAAGRAEVLRAGFRAAARLVARRLATITGYLTVGGSLRRRTACTGHRREIRAGRAPRLIPTAGGIDAPLTHMAAAGTPRHRTRTSVGIGRRPAPAGGTGRPPIRGLRATGGTGRGIRRISAARAGGGKPGTPTRMAAGGTGRAERQIR